MLGAFLITGVVDHAILEIHDPGAIAVVCTGRRRPVVIILYANERVSCGQGRIYFRCIHQTGQFFYRGKSPNQSIANFFRLAIKAGQKPAFLGSGRALLPNKSGFLVQHRFIVQY